LATQCYECLMILDSNRYARDPGVAAESVRKMIELFGGEILVSRLWAEQKLAFPIKGHQKGTYWLTFFKMDSLRIKELNRAAQLNELLVRFMITNVDPRLIDTLVAHAQGKHTTPPAEVRLAGIGVVDDLDEDLEEVLDN
jgi:small subunit ribosomal protein S6